MAHVYVDPRDPHYARPNLVERLMRYPSRRGLTPHENQITEALAWLLDRSPELARSFAGLFFAGDAEALRALDGATTFGTRTQLSMPVPGGTRHVYPDLSLVGDARSFELLVEVKVDAAPHTFEEKGEWLSQPDMYVRAWDARPTITQAELRRVATLTRDFAFPRVQGSATRGRDVRWDEVVDVVSSCLEEGMVKPSAVEVAQDFLTVVRTRVLSEGSELPPLAHVEALLDEWREVVLDIGRRLRECLPVEGATKCVRKKDYQGTYFWLRTPDGHDVQFWVTALPAGGRYNVRGHPDCLNFRIMDGADELTDERLLAGGFRYLEDHAGWRRYHIDWPLRSKGGHIDDPSGAAETATAHFVDALRTCDPPLAETQAPH